jgi:homopolymeric O-antigen transport system permease protein
MIEAENTVIAPSDACVLSARSVLVKSTDDKLVSCPEFVIKPQSGWIGINWTEMFAHRELLYYLVWRDISVRYKQTILGPAWAIFQPLFLMLIFTVVFSRFGKIDSQGVPYPVFVFAGLIPWTLFSQGMSQSSLSLVNQTNLLTKVYFPRLFIPISATAVFLIDLMFSLGIYTLLLLYYRFVPSWTIVFLPVLILLTLVATLGIGVMLSALTIFYRDFKHIVPFLVQIFMYVTPVIYSASALSPRARLILSLNPMFGIVTAYRSAILGLDWDFPSFCISAVTAFGLLVVAMFYFRRTERRFVDFA